MTTHHNVIHANKTNTVGIIANIHEPTYLGPFSLSLLKEWVELTETMYDEDTGLCINACKGTDEKGNPAYGLFASVEGNNPHVAVCGKGIVEGERK